ncbi:tetratricopeptide repeat protein [Aquimarina pacifica]|uniref:tetratricopeptide repeat protein n=1 Tax=Aquimarina pacifica TaxID=1296415 RepID=UPI00046EA1BA|nr:tetratricopeptide repeat protein [Aquimarina pacifica]
MLRLLLFVFLIVCIPVCTIAQELQQGFDALETGKYAKAKLFFENVLRDYPQHRTARLCYGRAIGLLGDSTNALSLFIKLKQEYPNDFEIKLNYAEALLWDKQFIQAEVFYEKLIIENSQSFPAVLGYANTLSNLKKYEQALNTVAAALKIQKGNPNAMVSRKYIRLGYANTMAQEKKYADAIALLKENLIDFPNDKDTQLTIANIGLMSNDLVQAQKAYIALAVDAKDSIISLNGLALVAHKRSKEKKALCIATDAKNRVARFKQDSILYVSTQARYIQALLWNQKYKSAKIATDQLQSFYPQDIAIPSLRATRGMYRGNFKTSLQHYEQILEQDTTSFDGNLGISNAYRALGDDMKSYEYAFKTLQQYPKQPDAEKLIKVLKKSHTPFVEEKTALTFDNGDNEAIAVHLKAEVPISTNAKTMVQYDYRTTKNTMTKFEASSHDFWLGSEYKFSGRTSLQAKIGVNSTQGFTTDYTAIIARATLSLKPWRLQTLNFGYTRELQNFNADLLNREIIMNNYILTYNLGTTINLGWFTQLIHTSQTDTNSRNLLFTSLYYTMHKKPVIKGGVNFQYITFDKQVPTIYFSPDQFKLGELFLEVLSDKSKDWYYHLSAALGQQFVEEDPATSTFRTEAKLGHHFSERFDAYIYGKYSNIASATAAGFEFGEVGFRLKWYFLSTPVFDKKIEALRQD